MMSKTTLQILRPPAEQGDRDALGQFTSGHGIGETTRFQPGQSGNPNGRPSFGASIKEWANVMGEWSKGQLQEIIDDDDAPSAKVAAAHQVLQARQGDGKAFDRLADRTEGRPALNVALRHEVAMRSPEAELAELERLCGFDRVTVGVLEKTP